MGYCMQYVPEWTVGDSFTVLSAFRPVWQARRFASWRDQQLPGSSSSDRFSRIGRIRPAAPERWRDPPPAPHAASVRSVRSTASITSVPCSRRGNESTPLGENFASACSLR